VSIADAYAGIVFDIDGVLIRGDAALPGAAETLRELEGRAVFVTNNASRTPDEIAAWLGNAGVAVDPARVVTSALAAAALIEGGTRCLVIGMRGLREALTMRGCVLDDDPETAEAVVVGFDRRLCWEDLRRATQAIVRGARFIGTNADASLPVEGAVWPGNGAILAALQAATDVEPEVAGKPNRPLFDAAADRLDGGPVLVVGDRVETDLAGAAAVGWDSALVLTGVTSRDAARAADPAPTYVLDSVAHLLA
jgi:glycerol-1-phosphatase